MAGSQTALAKLGIGVADPVDTPLNFSSFDPNITKELGNYNGTRGTFFLDGNRMIENRTMIMPRLSTEPTALEAGYLLAWIMGGTATIGPPRTYPWSDTPSPRNLHFKPIAGEQWFMGNVAVDNAVMQAASGGALSFDLDCVGMTFSDLRTDFPATLAYDQTSQPFLLTHLSFIVAGIERKPRDFSFTIAGGIDRDRYLNSPLLTALQRLSANFTVSFEVPSGDNAAGFWRAGIAGASASAVFTNPTTSAVLTFTFPLLKWAPNSPTHAPASEGFTRITATGTRIANGTPVSITLDPGP